MERKSIWKEPLVHFVALGLLIFLFFEWRGGGSGPDSKRIEIGRGQIQHLAAGFARTWQRAPTQAELKELIDDYVREEMAYREAVSMGLDRDDTVIRRRLRQKLEFLVEDATMAEPPSDTELEAWLDAHAESYAIEPQVAFRQVLLDPDRRGAAAEADARRLRERLAGMGPEAPIDDLGDSRMLPRDFGLAPRTEVARAFGESFADRLLEIEPGSWEGPLESGYGLHVVFVLGRLDGRTPTLDEVRPRVERDVVRARRAQQLERLYEGLLERYRVTVDRPPEEP